MRAVYLSRGRFKETQDALVRRCRGIGNEFIFRRGPDESDVKNSTAAPFEKPGALNGLGNEMDDVEAPAHEHPRCEIHIDRFTRRDMLFDMFNCVVLVKYASRRGANGRLSNNKK
ncbi:hypothetical protein EVAR_41224_1 [Eumeta japonica]|uniref:Uncharacterized protein n=1 Tax=Eumeta variegata TaxID=151549 RepID=A0A4C1W4J7_EUMVA|nr:hypothetical protein EVAR_41224_1 [Eumeta japonica]